MSSKLFSCLIIIVCGATSGPSAPDPFKGPETIPNPLSQATIAAIHSIVVGQYGPGEEWEAQPIEIVKDSYRLERIKKALGSPILHKMARPSLIGRSYQLICLDKNGKAVAGASYRLVASFRYVLQLSQDVAAKNGHFYDYPPGQTGTPGKWDPKTDYRAYVIPFNSQWQEAIGYTPGW